jgi:DNA-binding response OmpR family regulator
MNKAFIVEDHIDTAEALRFTAEAEGFTAETFFTFEECWTRMQAEEPCLLLMDYYVPCSMSPIVFLSLSKSKFPRLEIYVLSADHRLREKVIHLGARFMSKPFDPEKVQKIYAQHCG